MPSDMLTQKVGMYKRTIITKTRKDKILFGNISSTFLIKHIQGKREIIIKDRLRERLCIE